MQVWLVLFGKYLGSQTQAANDGIDVDNSVNFGGSIEFVFIFNFYFLAEAQMNYILGDTGRSYVCG